MPESTVLTILRSSYNFPAGPKELPRMGRALGKLTGRATGFIYKARAQLFNFAEKTELTKVQQELQMTMQQLQAIRNELQGGINILDPGPMSRQILGRAGGGGGGSAGGRGVGERVGKNSSVENISKSTTLSSQQQQSNLPFAASGVAASAAAAPRENITATATDSRIGSFQAAAQTQTLLQQPLQQHQHHSVEVLPISAAAAGLVPDRSQLNPAASEILADALQEEKIAQQALQFFQQQPQSTDSNTNSSGGAISTTASTSSGKSTVKKPRKPRAKKKGGTE